MAKTREEIIALFESESIAITKMIIKVDGYDKELVYGPHLETLPPKMHVCLPEHATYTLSIKYKAKKNLKKLRYYQVVKKYGIPFKTRDLEVADEVAESPDDDTSYEVVFPPDTLPGGALVRGTYPAVTKFYAEGVEIFHNDWSLDIIKKDQEPKYLGI